MMEQEKGYELVLNEEAEQKLEEYARKTGRTVDELFEFVISQYLNRQLGLIEKRAAETGVPLNQLISMQFIRLLTALEGQEIN